MYSIIKIIQQVSKETNVKFEDVVLMLFEYGYCDQYANLSDEVKVFYRLK